MPAPSPQSHASGKSADIDRLLGDWKLPDPSKSNDMALHGPPLMVQDTRLMEISQRFQSSGRVSVDGDIVTQHLGRGHTNEYSLSQLSAHAKDPEYFSATMRYAAEHGDSVKIDFHHNVASVRDPSLERSLPLDIPLRDPILRASVINNIDPVLLAAVGMQETDLGRSPYYNQKTHRGDVEPDSAQGHGYGPFQYDDQKRYGEKGRPQAELDRVASDPYYAAQKAAEMLDANLKQTNGNVSDALHLYNAGSLSTPSTLTDLGSQGKVSYEDSTLIHYSSIQQEATREQGHGLGR